MIHFDKAVPNQPCLVTNRSDIPVVDFGVHTQGLDQRVVLSVAALRQACEAAGFVSDLEFAELREANQNLGKEIEELRRENEDLKEFEEAATYTVEHLGQRVRRKPGPRPKKKPEEVAA